MTTVTSQKQVQSAITRFINRQPLSMKTACVEVLGTNRKTDVLRVLRTQWLLGYIKGGGCHEILPAGEFYFTHDADRRQAGKQLITSAPLGDNWADNGGSEIYITPINTFRLKKEFFDQRIMQMIDPLRPAIRNGLAASQAMAGVDLDQLEVSAAAALDEPTSGGLQYENEAMEKLSSCMAQGEDVPPSLRAAAYLHMPRTMALLNETAERAGIDLSDRVEASEHVGRWCSYPMNELLLDVFPNAKAWNTYLAKVSQVTAEAWLGYAPELV